MKYISLLSLVFLCSCAWTQPQNAEPEQVPVEDDTVVIVEDGIWEDQNLCQEEDEVCFVLFASPCGKVFRCSSEDAACVNTLMDAGFTRIGSEPYSPIKDTPFPGFPKENWGPVVMWQLR